jgi:hypothetical protein
MILNKNILILEDNLKVLSKLLEKLDELEWDQPYSLSVMVLTNYQQVQDFINGNSKANFDIIVLDRDCKLNGSFHVLDIEKLGVNKVISISTVEEYNEEAKKRGVTRIVPKDLSDLDTFSEKVAIEVGKLLRNRKNNAFIKG